MKPDDHNATPVASQRRAPYSYGDAMSLRALLIDDDLRLSDLLTSYLGQNGVAVTHAGDGSRGLSMLDSGAFDVVLLDIMMPGLDGLEVCKRIRAKSSVPILMLTARGDETDRVVGLEMGADDYLAKPFSARELLARIRAVLRRTMPDPERERLTAGEIVIDVGSREVHLSGRNVECTGIEFDLLVALVRRAGRVVPRDALLTLAGRARRCIRE